MFGLMRKKPKLDTSSLLDGIEKEVYEYVKPYGFKKHGRTLHRFVSEDISQVIHFQLGQAYRGETHLLVVSTGIRVPECMTRRFTAEETKKKYYHDYECNIRSNLGIIEGKEISCYNLYKSTAAITADILRQMQKYVIPAFEALNSRDAILARRRDYPRFDILSGHLILLEEAMIYGLRGEAEKAADTFNLYYHQVTLQHHLSYLNELAETLGIEITEKPK